MRTKDENDENIITNIITKQLIALQSLQNYNALEP